MANTDSELRFQAALDIVKSAAATALAYYQDPDGLTIDSKSRQDWVSNADREVEWQIRNALAVAFPDDAILGEEHGLASGSSGYTWVIDPIDGTTCFVNSMPGWCVVLACVTDANTIIAAICDPVTGEFFSAQRGQGATLNGRPIKVSNVLALDDGSLGVGHSMRVDAGNTARLLNGLLAESGLYYRNGSGALCIAYVAAGRLIGYCEPHMNAWDCVAAMLLVEEAGGCVEDIDMPTMLQSGGRVVVTSPGVKEAVFRLVDSAYIDTAS